MKIRSYILSQSISLEFFTSLFLSILLKTDGKSYSFGNTSQSLSFSQKINLLIDIGTLPPDVKNKFIAFMEIRNQFMHNIFAESYEDCMEQCNGRKKFLLDNYPQDVNLAMEEQLENATHSLCDEVRKLTINITKKFPDISHEMLEKAKIEAISKFG